MMAVFLESDEAVKEGLFTDVAKLMANGGDAEVNLDITKQIIEEDPGTGGKKRE